MPNQKKAMSREMAKQSRLDERLPIDNMGTNSSVVDYQLAPWK